MAEHASSAPPAAPRRVVFHGYWIVVAAFVAQMVAVGTQLNVAGAFLKPMADELDWTRAEYTYAQTGGQVIMAAMGFWIGARVDRYGGRRFMLVGMVIVGLTLLATSQVQNLWQWVILRGLVFMVGASMVGNLVVNVTLSKWWVRRRGTMIGFASMGVSMAGVVFPNLAALLIEEFGWRTAWRILAVIAVVLLIPSALVMRRQPEDMGLHPDGLSDEQNAGAAGQQAAMDFANSFTRAEALRTPALYLIVFAFAIGGAGIVTMLFQTIPFLTDSGYSGSEAGRFTALMSASSLVSKPFWGSTVSWIEAKVTAALGFVIAGISLCVVVLAASNGTTPLLIAGYVALGIGFGSQIPLQETIWGTYFGRRYLGSVRGVALPFSLGLGAGTPLFTSWYFDLVGNYTGVFLGVAGLWVVAAAIIMAAKRPVKPAPSDPAASAAA